MTRQQLQVIGVGPGDPSYLTKKSKDILLQADVVAGFSDPLETVSACLDVDPVVLSYQNQEKKIEELRERTGPDDRVVVCCWGDPSVSDEEFLDRLREAGFSLQLIPGVSSIQIACARSDVPFEKTLFITFHKRGDRTEDRKELLRTVKEERRHVICLPHPYAFMPPDMAGWLIENDVSPERSVTVHQELTLPDESSRTCSLRTLADSDESFSDLTIVLFHPS